jgi:hypothetical protein
MLGQPAPGRPAAHPVQDYLAVALAHSDSDRNRPPAQALPPERRAWESLVPPPEQTALAGLTGGSSDRHAADTSFAVRHPDSHRVDPEDWSPFTLGQPLGVV